MKKIGILEVICGPMFSGKSEELIRRLRRAKIAKQSVAVFKHASDDRYDLEQITSHNGTKIKAYPAREASQIVQEINTHNYTVVGIDEVHFFSQKIVATICQLVDNGKRVVVSGLDLDFRGIPFGPMPILLAIADKITKLQSICNSCGQDAHFSQRLVNNEPAKFDDPIIQIGAQEAYHARCRQCYQIDKPTDHITETIQGI